MSLVLLIARVCLATVACAFPNAATFGKKPDDDRVQRIVACAHYVDGAFQNLTPHRSWRRDRAPFADIGRERGTFDLVALDGGQYDLRWPFMPPNVSKPSRLMSLRSRPTARRHFAGGTDERQRSVDQRPRFFGIRRVCRIFGHARRAGRARLLDHVLGTLPDPDPVLHKSGEDVWVLGHGVTVCGHPGFRADVARFDSGHRHRRIWIGQPGR